MNTTFHVSDIFFDKPQITLKFVNKTTADSFMITLHDEQINTLIDQLSQRDAHMIAHLKALCD